jgi:hypothetical protein
MRFDKREADTRKPLPSFSAPMPATGADVAMVTGKQFAEQKDRRLPLVDVLY